MGRGPGAESPTPLSSQFVGPRCRAGSSVRPGHILKDSESMILLGTGAQRSLRIAPESTAIPKGSCD